jgi:hypothetical protein
VLFDSVSVFLQSVPLTKSGPDRRSLCRGASQAHFVRTPKEIRSMDRRRFVPSPEGLEVRTLQATNLNTLFGLQLSTNLNIPITYQQRLLRIERLPYYLERIRPGRFLPKPEIQQIQSSLYDMLEVIHRPPTQGLNDFNYNLRKIVSKESLTATDIHSLNQTFTGVLNSALTPPAAVSGLKTALYQLTSQVDTASVLPVYLATNDTTLVLETALAIGRPMPPPALPRIAKNEGIQANINHIKTPLLHPSVTGTYHFHTDMEIITPESQVVGLAKVHYNNDYRVKVETPLAPGVYEFYLRAVDEVGHLSHVSRPFLIKVVPKKHHPHDTIVGAATPKGPLASSKS